MMPRLLALVACLAAFGCATPYAKLDGVLSDVRPTPQPASQGVTIIHGGQSRTGAPQQSVLKGDTMRTLPGGVAILTLRPGYELIVEPGSEISIENPSIFVTVGKLFLKKLKAAREALRLNTKFVSAGVEGTQFVFEVTRDDVVRLTVLEGFVWLRSRTTGWTAVTYRAGESVTIRDGEPPGRIQQVDPASMRAIQERSLAIERAAGYRTGQPWSRFTPLFKKPIFFIPAAVVGAAVGVILVTQGGDSQGTVTIHIPF